MNTILVHNTERFEASLFNGSEILPNRYTSIDIGSNNLDIHVFIDEVETLDKLIAACNEAREFLESEAGDE